MANEWAGEPQYQDFIAEFQKNGPERMGFMTSWAWIDDPRRLAFMLSRYKFVSKMLADIPRVLEVGCGDGFGSRVVASSVGYLKAVDFDGGLLQSAIESSNDKIPVDFALHDMLSGPVPGTFDAAYSLDVLEHISEEKENIFLANAVLSLTQKGVVIIGMPSLESQTHASRLSKLGHVNCKTQPQLKATMSRFFDNVFLFSMNDEVVHTGYSKMSHYNLALCCGRKGTEEISRLAG